MPIIIQDARSALGAEGWRIGMSVINMKKIISQEEKLNLMKCRRLASTSVSPCRRSRANLSRPWSTGTTRRATHTHAFTCPGKSTKEEEYSEQIVIKCKNFMKQLGYKRVAMKSDQETAMRALQQRVQKSVNREMVLTNSKRYDSKSNGKERRPSRRSRGT